MSQPKRDWQKGLAKGIGKRMTATAVPTAAPVGEKKVSLTIDGKFVSVPEGTTLWEAAAKLGINIPQLCHASEATGHVNLNPVGVCRVCCVEVTNKGAPGPERVYAASCARACSEGMTVLTGRPETVAAADEAGKKQVDAHNKVLAARKTLVELLLADHPRPCKRHAESKDCELEDLADKLGITDPVFTPRSSSKGSDNSNPSIAINHSACILCDRCIRACTDVKGNDVIGRMGKGYSASISFDNNKPMGESSCVNCGECMISCPTGAITYSGDTFTKEDGTPVRVTELKSGKLEGEQLQVEDLLKMPMFAGISSNFLRRSEGGVVRKRYKKGQIICRQGDFGSTAYFIESGTVSVYIDTPVSHVSPKNSNGFFKKITSVLAPRAEQPRKGEGNQAFIHIDAPVDLPYSNPVAQLQAGDLFGEMTCMNFYPRSATVRAKEDVVVLEMLRNVLDILRKNRDFRKKIDFDYRQRALDNHLRSTKIFKDITPEFMNYLRDKVELVRFAKGEVICRQGEVADAFYLVRSGHVKVTQSYPGGDVVLNYLGKGHYFGEIGLLGGGLRTASCLALDHVDVVKITKRDFDKMVYQFPEIKQQLVETAKERLQDNIKQIETLRTGSIDQFLNQGLMEAQSLLILDLERCVRCDECVKACADAHDGVTRLIRDGLRFDKYLVATSCRQCRDPLCMIGCPVGSIRRRPGDLNIFIEDWCIGCGLCGEQCPYGNINMHPFNEKTKNEEGLVQIAVRNKATSCDLDYHAGDPDRTPACVYACPHDAAFRVEPQTFFDVHLRGEKVTGVAGDFRPQGDNQVAGQK